MSDRGVVLASASAARRAMLAAAGLEFDVDPAVIDEVAIRADLRKTGAGPADIALGLAAAKATDVSERHAGKIVIGSDQVLDLDGEMLSKARSVADAADVLRRLSGKAHELHAGVTLATDGMVIWRHVAAARMSMRAFSDAFLDRYLAAAGPAVLESVGAYQVEGVGIQLFDRVEGDHFTILGMPLLPLLAELRRRGALMS